MSRSRATAGVARLLVSAAALAAAAGCGTATGPAPVPAAAAAASETPSTGLPAPVAAADQAPGTCSAFSLSLVSDRGGRPTPAAAAEWFSAHGGVAGVPPDGWRQDGTDGAGASMRSGAVTLHVVHGPDGTWQVDSGSWC